MNKLLIFLLLPLTLCAAPLKVLHLSFHKGCINAIDVMAQDLGLDITHWYMADHRNVFEPLAQGNAIYNMTHALAAHIWKQNKAFFETFDAIITSDTAPLARIFLQNNWRKPLIVWICNRFDYADFDRPNGFPDEEYYELMRKASTNPNVYLVANTEFEKAYAATRNVTFRATIIKPYFKHAEPTMRSAIDPQIQKTETCFIPNYSNDLFYLNHKKIYQKLGIKTFRGYYSEPADLKDFKGIIHVPYAYSTIAFFENLANHIPYFIPSKNFLLKLHATHDGFWHQNREWLFNAKRFNVSEWYNKEHAPLFIYFNLWFFNAKRFNLSEWYNKEHTPLFIYFDSWQHLKELTQTTNFSAVRNVIATYAQQHEETMRNRWKAIFDPIMHRQ